MVVVVLPLIEIHLFIKGNEIFRGNEKRRYVWLREGERERERKREFLGPFKEKNGKLGNFCFSLFRF